MATSSEPCCAPRLDPGVIDHQALVGDFHGRDPRPRRHRSLRVPASIAGFSSMSNVTPSFEQPHQMIPVGSPGLQRVRNAAHHHPVEIAVPPHERAHPVHRLQRLVASELHVAHCLDDIIAPLAQAPCAMVSDSAAIDRHGRAGDIVGGVGQQEGDHSATSSGVPGRPQGIAASFAASSAGSSIADWFIGVRIIPGAMPLTAIRLRRQFQRQRRRQLRQAALGRIIIDPAGARRALVDRADIDDPPAALAGPAHELAAGQERPDEIGGERVPGTSTAPSPRSSSPTC